jgi:hypothetical protein
MEISEISNTHGGGGDVFWNVTPLVWYLSFSEQKELLFYPADRSNTFL